MGLHAILIDSCPEGLPQYRLPWLLFPWPAPGVKNPVQGQRCFLIFDSCGECMEFLPLEEKAGFSEMGELYSLGWVSSLPFWEWVLLLMEKGKTALPGPRSRGPCQVIPAEPQTQLQQHPRWKQEETEARIGRWRLTQPHAGDQEQNKIVQKK